MPQATKYVPTDKEQAFLDTVENVAHKREIINGLAPFFKESAPEDLMGLYSSE